MPFSEQDWKHLRHVHAIALDRFCTQVLAEATAIAQSSAPSAHERYGQLFHLMRDRNAAMARAFDDMRRSTGMLRLMTMVSLNLLTNEDLAGFSRDVQDAARKCRPVSAPRRKPGRSR